ncbi:hypothetical protein LVJ83_01335 [Uruburuella testudinis]|uniref:Pilus assembly protein PilP n=1 Tax=Uruburuella testudinis TaxID=1282863 RepID=A0ABY4DTG6_9NEIS|nr:hypothetical protein [Uruburuella testudinis]UOO82151.1 hypothetical protein LVJ83_01335 [Uruburuella testudinis]
MRYFFAVCVLLCTSMVWAQRAIPQDMDVAVLKRVSYPQIVLSNDGLSWLKILTLGWLDRSAVFEVAPAVRIRDEHNRFIVRGKLVAKTGKTVAVRRDGGNRILEIWVLSEPERQVFEQLGREVF